VTTFNVLVQSKDDGIYENTETYTIYVGKKEGTGTIQNIDDPIVKSVGDDAKLEGAVLTHEVNVTSSVEAVTYDFRIADGTAVVGEDYNATPTFDNNVTYDANGGTITVPAGVTTFNVLVHSIADGIVEGNETYTMHVGDQIATGTIIEITNPIVKSVGNDTKLEGEVLSHAVEVTSSVDDETYTFSIADDTATVGEDFNATPSFTAGVTYDANSGNITVPAGVTSFDVFVRSLGDNVSESNETYTITVGSQTAIGTIIDDTPIVVESISSDSVTELGELTHHIVLSATTSKAVDFNLSIVNITTSDNDYERIPDVDILNNIPGLISVNLDGTIVTVPAGVKEFNLYIQTLDNADNDALNETYRIIFGDQSAIGTIRDGA